MAKKKTAETANIKAGPVLRAQSEDPTKTKSYCVRDDWKDKGIVNYVAFKSVDGEVQDLTVNGEPAGGGGYASVLVNVVSNLQDDLNIIMPFASDENIITTQVLINAGINDDYQVLAPSIGYIDANAQHIQTYEVIGTGGVTVTSIGPDVYQLNFNGAGSIRIE